MIKVISITPENPEVFDKEINKQPAFVKIYQPWCGYCKMVAPIWEKLGKELQKNYTGSLSLIDVHGDATDKIESVVVKNVSGYPTIFEVKSNGVKGDNYEGDRSFDDMLNFIVERANLRKNSSNSQNGGGARKKSKKTRKTRRTRRTRRKVRMTKRQRRHSRTYSRSK